MTRLPNKARVAQQSSRGNRPVISHNQGPGKAFPSGRSTQPQLGDEASRRLGWEVRRSRSFGRPLPATAWLS
jgi:hypothetical protein